LNEERVWKDLLHNKYLKHKNGHNSQMTAASQFWKGLMGFKDELFSRGSFSIGNGLETWFWENTWLGDTPLGQTIPISL
jgi:hypothetical protein